jgi:protein-export membrane protein SecD/preprotein translocase SecF subunit
MVKRSRIVAFFLIIVLLGSLMGLTTNGVLKNIKLGLDLQGGFEVLYKVEPVEKGQKIDEKALASTAEALNERINVLGVSEPNIQIESNNRIRVQLAGVEDQNQAREILSTTAYLTFRDANDKKLLDGTDIVQGSAKQSFDQAGKPNVTLEIKDAEKFAEATEHVLKQSENVMVIWLDFEEGKDSYQAEKLKDDPKFISAPSVDQVLRTNNVEIRGSFTPEEAQTLANLLNAGSLPVKLVEEYSTSVGAQFGEKALQSTVFAGIIGVALIFLFMILYYRLPGVIAVITLSVYIYLILVVFDWMNAVLTLPGIAALLLGVGMAVDANILTYERLKEEIKVGRSLKAAFTEGNKTSLATILDANLTTILAAIVLFIYGTSSVKGFATMLIVSILVSFITAVYGSRILLGLLIQSKMFNKRYGWFGVKKEDIKDIAEGYDTLELPTRFDKWDLVKHHKKFFTFSSVLIIVGVILLFTLKLNLGIDFSSGTRIEIVADKSLSTAEIKEELNRLDIQTDDIVLAGEKDEIAAVRYKGVLNKDEIAELKNHFSEKYGHEPNVSAVTPTVGKELAKNAIIGVIIAAIGIIIYVTLRFEIKMAVASVLALLHDAFVILAVFSIVRFEVDLTFIAAVLTVIGYSINDTIVTFDRIRAHMKRKRRIKQFKELVDIVNSSLRQTLTRSINTVLTVVFVVVALLIFGSESIKNFSFALLIGLIAGTYSSLFIAAQVWLVWKGKELKKKGTIITYKEKKKYSDQPQV